MRDQTYGRGTQRYGTRRRRAPPAVPPAGMPTATARRARPTFSEGGMGRLRRMRFLLLAAALAWPAPDARGQSILTVAGGGTDDGRLATTIQLASPRGVAADVDGNVFVAD